MMTHLSNVGSTLETFPAKISRLSWYRFLLARYNMRGNLMSQRITWTFPYNDFCLFFLTIAWKKQRRSILNNVEKWREHRSIRRFKTLKWNFYDNQNVYERLDKRYSTPSPLESIVWREDLTKTKILFVEDGREEGGVESVRQISTWLGTKSDRHNSKPLPYQRYGSEQRDESSSSLR